jgi:hypothetical protein
MAQFKDAGKTYGNVPTMEITREPYYETIRLDLDKFPEFDKDLGEQCIFTVKAAVKAKNISEHEKCVTLEIRKISKDYENGADKALDTLRNKTARY